jgi:hypothetical protein
MNERIEMTSRAMIMNGEERVQRERGDYVFYTVAAKLDARFQGAVVYVEL